MEERKRIRHRLYRCVLCCVSASFLSLSLCAQENVLRVQFEHDSLRNSTIGIFRRQGMVYGSLTDLAQIFSQTTFINTAAGKIEIKQPPYRIKVSGGNPFLVVTDQTPVSGRGGTGVQRQTVYQLSSSVIFAAKSFFVPLTSFLPYFELVFKRSVSYDARAGVLRVGAIGSLPRFDISTLVMEQKINGMFVRIPVTKALVDFESWLRQDGWLYVTIADAHADTAAINALTPLGIIKEIVAIQSPTSVQLTFKLSGKITSSEIYREDNSHDILLSIRTPAQIDKRVLEKKQRQIQTGLENQRKRWMLDVIVIDPGHGGRDGGATGVTKVREKDVTLGISLKLGRLIQKNLKGVKVVYTRNDDSFVELDRRGQVANEAGGKLFISIHCNSMPRKPSPMRGFEVYLLRPGRTEEAIAIAERENSVIQLEEGFEQRYTKLTDENFILVTMAQSAHVKSSELFADIAQQEIESRAGIPNRGVKQAGFYVLVGAAMPNVLIETAYLSNREDERFLKSETGQAKLAESLLRAISRYKQEYEKLLMEGKDIGQIK